MKILRNVARFVGVCAFLTATLAIPSFATVLYEFSVPAQPDIPFGPLRFIYLAPELITLQNMGNNIPGSALFFQSADFPISSVAIDPGGVINPNLSEVPEVRYTVDNPHAGFAGQVIPVDSFIDHFGTFTGGLGSTLTVAPVPEASNLGLVGFLAVFGGAAIRRRRQQSLASPSIS
jgi:MYXO-CTERM domain-containing protein